VLDLCGCENGSFLRRHLGQFGIGANTYTSCPGEASLRRFVLALDGAGCEKKVSEIMDLRSFFSALGKFESEPTPSATQ
jgi:hypothetical protein